MHDTDELLNLISLTLALALNSLYGANTRMTADDISKLPRTVEVNGKIFSLVGTGSCQIRYANEAGETVTFPDTELKRLIESAIKS